MPVGGIKEKVLAAHRSGLKTVILPRRNEADLEDLPDDVREVMKFVFADTVDDVLETRPLKADETPEKLMVVRKKLQGALDSFPKEGQGVDRSRILRVQLSKPNESLGE